VLAATHLAAIFLVFPTGRLPSARWRPAATVGLVLTGLSLAAFVVGTRLVALPAPGGISLLSQPARGPVPPGGHLARHPERPGLPVPAAAGGRAGVARAPVPAAVTSGCASR